MRHGFTNLRHLVGMEGFEPSKPVAPVLQTGLIRHHQSIPLFFDASVINDQAL